MMVKDNNPSQNDSPVIENDCNEPYALVELTGFQRDILFVVVKLEQQTPNGKQIKSELSEHYDELTTGRLYQNLRHLTGRDLIDTRPIDGRTKAYRLSHSGRERLEAYYRWLTICLQSGETDCETTDERSDQRSNHL